MIKKPWMQLNCTHMPTYCTYKGSHEDRNGINTMLNLQGVQYLVIWAK